MDARVEVTRKQIDAATNHVVEWLLRRLKNKGWMGYIGPHETLGIIEEEMHELRDAVISDQSPQVVRELTDVAVGCIFGIASTIANGQPHQVKL